MDIFILLTILFFITFTIVVFDNQLIRAVKSGALPPDEPQAPKWVALVYWIWIGLGVSLLIINWQSAIFVFLIFVTLSYLGIFEIIGNTLMSPFKSKTKK